MKTEYWIDEYTGDIDGIMVKFCIIEFIIDNYGNLISEKYLLPNKNEFVPCPRSNIGLGYKTRRGAIGVLKRKIKNLKLDGTNGYRDVFVDKNLVLV